MAEWVKHHTAFLPVITPEEWQEIEYLTGRIPLLLRALLGPPGEDRTYEGERGRILRTGDFMDIQNWVTLFAKKQHRTLGKARFIEACSQPMGNHCRA